MASEERKTSGVAALLVGAAAGAVLGVLFAPKKGTELREDAGKWLRRSREKTSEAYSAMKARSADVLRDAKEKVNSKAA